MGRKLSQMGWKEVKSELSIAGDPEKMVQIGRDIHELIASRINVHSIPEVENVQFILKVVIAELKLWEKIERSRQHPKNPSK